VPTAAVALKPDVPDVPALGTAMGCHELTFRLPALRLEGYQIHMIYIYVRVCVCVCCIYIAGHGHGMPRTHLSIACTESRRVRILYFSFIHMCILYIYMCICIYIYIMLGTAMGCHELTFRLPALRLDGYQIYYICVCVCVYIYICIYIHIYIYRYMCMLGTAVGCHELTFRLPALRLEGYPIHMIYICACVCVLYI